jgi:hypothetical protein
MRIEEALPCAVTGTCASAVADKPTRREMAKQIQKLADDGLTLSEIARILFMKRQRAKRIAGQYGVRLQPRGGRKRISIHIGQADYDVAFRVADGAGVSVGVIIRRMAETYIHEGETGARKRLGKLARPKRRYRS